MNLLHIDSSILGAHSVSRTLTAAIVAREKALHPGLAVTTRDLAAQPALQLSGQHLAAFQGAPVENAAVKADIALGGAFMEELFAADIIVIGAPMYNFSIPTQLKAWIDRVVVAGKTFRYTEKGPEGLLPPGKKVIIASARGGTYGEGSPAAFLEHHETYLRGVLGFVGLTDVTIIRAEGIAAGPEAKETAIADAQRQVAALAA